MSNTRAEWDRLADDRHRQIVSHLDLSYHLVLIPSILSMLGDVRRQNILDVGCGTGALCNKLANLGATAVGVDFSDRMISIALREYGRNPRVVFHRRSIESFSRAYRGKKFDACVSNMALVTMPNLEPVMKAVASVLKPKGTFAFTITHPCFWNRYRKYEVMTAHDYLRDHAERGVFTISLDRSIREKTTHFHRPLSSYFEATSQASFLVKTLSEPMPKGAVLRLYPRRWEFPRFLSIKAVYLPTQKTSNHPIQHGRLM